MEIGEGDGMMAGLLRDGADRDGARAPGPWGLGMVESEARAVVLPSRLMEGHASEELPRSLKGQRSSLLGGTTEPRAGRESGPMVGVAVGADGEGFLPPEVEGPTGAMDAERLRRRRPGSINPTKTRECRGARWPVV